MKTHFKSEARNPKFETNPNFQNSKHFLFRALGFWSLENCFGFRYSRFGFIKSLSKFWLVVFTFYFYLLPLICFAQSLSSTELINNAKQYDGQTVVYDGEVVGDVMLRGEYAWINLNDGENALGIWVPKASAEIITFKGSYNAKGDWLEVTGEFHRACPQHGGDLDIHASSLKKISSGRTLKYQPIAPKVHLAIVLGGLLCILLILKIYKKK